MIDTSMEYQLLRSVNQGNNHINKHDVAIILSLKPNGYFHSCLKQQGGFFKIQEKWKKTKPLRQPWKLFLVQARC